MEIRCLIKHTGDLYVAMSLDFGLAAQGDSEVSAREKLFQQIEEYINEAIEEDSMHREALLSRKGPLSWFIIYYLARLHLKGKEILAFTEVKPVMMKETC